MAGTPSRRNRRRSFKHGVWASKGRIATRFRRRLGLPLITAVQPDEAEEEDRSNMLSGAVRAAWLCFYIGGWAFRSLLLSSPMSLIRGSREGELQRRQSPSGPEKLRECSRFFGISITELRIRRRQTASSGHCQSCA